MDISTIRDYMKNNLDDNCDPITGEVNPTKLAEDALWHFDLPEDDFENLCELALEFTEDDEDESTADDYFSLIEGL